MTYPLTELRDLYAPRQVEEYLSTLFRNVEWEDGQLISLLGIGEKGTAQEGKFRERKIIPPAFIGSAHEHLKRWAQYHVAGFIVPAVLHNAAAEAGDVTLDKVAALTAIILDLDSGDTDAKASYVNAALGQPSMVVASGGTTDQGKPKLHLYWLFNEPCEEVERVAAARKALAAKVGGDQSFGRATQVVRVAGSVHAKNGKAAICRILSRSACEYSFDELADIINDMLPMPGLPAPKLDAPLPGGLMDFTPKYDGAIDALHRDVHANGEELTRWGEFSKVAGFHIAEARAGRIGLDTAYQATSGWVLSHMVPPWPEDRVQQEFGSLVKVDVTRHGPFPQTILAQAQPPLPAVIEPTPARFPIAATIPPRPWLLGRWMMRGKVTAMIAPGGVGKSTLTSAIALSLASGRELLGKTVYGGPLKAWLWNLEDDGDSLARQRVAAAIHHKLMEEHIEGRLFVDSGPDGAELCTAMEDRNNFTIIEPVMDNITAAIKRHGIDALIIDPFVSSHRVNENDNNKIDAVAKRWARVATSTGCSIVLVHHSRKLGDDQVTADSARGAGALNNAARMTLVLNRMQPEQAESWGIDPAQCKRFFSVGDDKHNLAPAEGADWFELVSVNLGNGTDIHEADSVGVVTPWKPPRVMDGVDVDHLLDIQRVLSSGTYWKNPTKTEPWAGDVVAKVLKIDAVEPSSKKRIVKMLNTWVSNGTLAVETRENKQRKPQDCLTVGRWIVDPSSPSFPRQSDMETDNG